MKSLLLAPLLIFSCFLFDCATTPARSDSYRPEPRSEEVQTDNPVLQAYTDNHMRTSFVRPRMSQEGRLVVYSSTNLEDPLSRKAEIEAINTTCLDWIRAMRSSHAPADPSVLVVSPQGGSLWGCGEQRATPISEWSDQKIPDIAKPKIGNTYVSLALQNSMSPGSKTYGIHLAKGLTSKNGHFDMAYTTSDLITNASTLAKINIDLSVGLLVRYHTPVSSIFGVHFGFQPAMVMSVISPPSGKDSASTLGLGYNVNLLAGFNFSVPTGTIDFSGSMEKNGTYSFLLGHTFFFNVR